MDPLTAGLWVAANFALSARSSRAQAKVENANNKLQLEQQRLQAAEQAYEKTKAFKSNMATNLALAGIGKGGLTGFRGVAAQSSMDYFDDINAINRADTFAQIQSNANKAQSKTNRLLRDVSSLESAASLASKLGIFKGKGK